MGIGMPEISLLPQSDAHALLGHLDSVDWRRFHGWACNADERDAAVWLEIVIDDNEPVPFLANMMRTDVAQAGFGNGCHGFDLNFARPIDPRQAHVVAVRRAEDGAHLAGSPWQLPAAPAGGPEARTTFERIVSAEIEATATSVERLAMTHFLVRQTDRLLQSASDTDTGRDARKLYRRRWVETLEGTPVDLPAPDRRPLALLVDIDLPTSGAPRKLVSALQNLGMNVCIATMRNTDFDSEAAKTLADTGCALLGAPMNFTVEDVLRRNAPDFRVVILCGPVPAAAYAVTARLYHPNARILSWIADPALDPAASIAAQLLCDVTLTEGETAAADLRKRIAGRPVQIIDFASETRNTQLSAAIAAPRPSNIA